MLCFALSAGLHAALMLLLPDVPATRRPPAARASEIWTARLLSPKPARGPERRGDQQARGRKPTFKLAPLPVPMPAREPTPQAPRYAPQIALVAPPPISPTAPPPPRRVEKVDLQAAFSQLQQARRQMDAQGQRAQHLAWLRRRAELLANLATEHLNISSETYCTARAPIAGANPGPTIHWQCSVEHWAVTLAQSEGELATLVGSLLRLTDAPVEVRLGPAQSATVALEIGSPSARADQGNGPR